MGHATHKPCPPRKIQVRNLLHQGILQLANTDNSQFRFREFIHNLRKGSDGGIHAFALFKRAYRQNPSGLSHLSLWEQ